MSKSIEKYLEKYVYDLMPKRVRHALDVARESLYSGQGNWVKNQKIVEDWWNENMRDDFVVDDGGNVSTLREYENFADEECVVRYKEALKEAKKDGLEDDEAEDFARKEQGYYRDSFSEAAVLYGARAVRHIVLGREWT